MTRHFNTEKPQKTQTTMLAFFKGSPSAFNKLMQTLCNANNRTYKVFTYKIKNKRGWLCYDRVIFNTDVIVSNVTPEMIKLLDLELFQESIFRPKLPIKRYSNAVHPSIKNQQPQNDQGLR